MNNTKDFSTVKKVLSDYNFSDFTWIYCRPTVADLFKPDKRCGIYVFRFRNNEFYVGQAVDVIRRYVQHLKIHDDIQEISFKTFPENQFNKVEQEIVKTLEKKKVKLRNINLTSTPKGETDLDLIIPTAQQEHWLTSNTQHKLGEHLIDQPDLQSKYTKKFQQLLKREDFHDFVFPFLKEYFSRCVIQPAKTELSFWSLTCLPFQNRNHIDLCRLNLFWCEVLTIFVRQYEDYTYSFHLTKSLLTKTYLKELHKQIKTLGCDDHFYIRGGPDQFRIFVQDFDDAMKILQDNQIVRAIKIFNLRQMQKGATVYGRYHCIDLAKLLLTEHSSR